MRWLRRPDGGDGHRPRVRRQELDAGATDRGVSGGGGAPPQPQRRGGRAVRLLCGRSVCLRCDVALQDPVSASAFDHYDLRWHAAVAIWWRLWSDDRPFGSLEETDQSCLLIPETKAVC